MVRFLSMHLVSFVTVAFSGVAFVSAALYEDVRQLPTTTFDFVIVGGECDGALPPQW